MAGSFGTVGKVRAEIVRLLQTENPKIGLILRYLIYYRDDLRCVYCTQDYAGRTEALTLDHIIPQSKGGGSHIDNLVTSCKKCNEKKGDILFGDRTALLLIKTLIWQANRNVLRNMSLEPKTREILETLIASVEKKVCVFWDEQQHLILEWNKGFTLKNLHTGECFKIEQRHAEIGQKDSESKKRGKPGGAYDKLVRIMKSLQVTAEDING